MCSSLVTFVVTYIVAKSIRGTNDSNRINENVTF